MVCYSKQEHYKMDNETSAGITISNKVRQG